MNLLRTKAIAQKEWIQIHRDPLSLAMAFLLPVILLIIFAYAITLDVDNLSMVVYDRDRSSLSRELIAELERSGYFSTVAYLDSYHEIDPYFDAGRANVALVIPYNFSKNLRTQRPAEIESIIDGSQSNTATIALGYLTAIAGQFGQRLAVVPPAPVIDLRNRVWYNPELKSRNFIIPGLVAIIMSVIIALLTSLTIAREWDRGTMEQLISTPVTRSEVIIGKMTPYFVIGLIDTAVSIIMATLVFGVPLRGSITLLLVASAIFLTGGLSVGILISIVARNQLFAAQLAMLSSFLPSFMLSGFIFSIANMPAPLRAFTYVVPARYFVTVLKGVFLKGIGLRDLWLEMLLLSVFATVVIMLAIRKFQKRMG